MKKHPLNKDFSWPVRSGPFRIIDEGQAIKWNEDGYFILSSVLEEDTVAQLLAAIDPLENKTESLLAKQPNGRFSISRAGEITFTTHIVKHSEVARAFLKSPLFVDLCLDLIGDDCRLYWDQAVYKKPGTQDEFPWHQDNGYTFVQPQDYLTCWIPLTDATIDNGCPWAVPGVHLEGTLDHRLTDLGFQCFEDPEGAVPLEVKAGDIAVFSSLTPHRTGPNLTETIRKAYIAQFAHSSAAMYPREGKQGIPQNDAQRQFKIVENGKPLLD